MPELIGAALSAGISYRDLDGYLSTEDVLDILEVVATDAHNAAMLRRAAEAEANKG